MQPKFVELFKAARRVGTPLIAVQTPDPAATIGLLQTKAVAKDNPIIIWDLVRGWRPANEPGGKAITMVMQEMGGQDVTAVTGNPVESLVAAQKLPEKSILFVLHGNRYLRDDGSQSATGFMQAVWNLRDAFKTSLRTLVLLAPQFSLPPEISNDVLMLDEPLPTDEELQLIVQDVMDSAGVKITDAVRAQAIDALRGLAAFPAEQATAMSTSPSGLDISALWDRKRKMIEASPGLSVWAGGEKLANVGGNANIKDFVTKIIKGKESPLTIVFVDEIEKALAGATNGVGDSSGVSQGQLEVILREMQDNEWAGVIFIGPPGAGKSAIAKAIGGEAEVPTIALDLNGMKASLVGQSEERLRNAMKVIKAVGAGRVLFVATCNKISTLPPELKRRFTMGTFFFDLPDEQERAVIWDIYRKKFQLEDPELPDDAGWTGAEIKQACLLAYRLQIPLKDTAQFIVPVAKSAAEEIAQLRQQAQGRFLSASKPGYYEMPSEHTVPAPRQGRRMSKEVA